MVAHVDVLGSRAHFRKSCKLERSGVVLKDLTVNVRFRAYHGEVLLPHFLDQVHDRNDIAKSHRHRDVLRLGGGERDLRLQLGCPNDWASGKGYEPSAARFRRAGVVGGERPVPIA